MRANLICSSLPSESLTTFSQFQQASSKLSELPFCVSALPKAAADIVLTSMA